MARKRWVRAKRRNEGRIAKDKRLGRRETEMEREASEKKQKEGMV